MSERLETSVLVVGGGPTGLLASILLSKYGIRHVLVEQRPDTLKAPAAHVVNTRTMEIYRQAGLDVAELYALNTHPRASLVAWQSRLDHDPIGVFDMASNHDALMAQSMFSGEHTTNISQHRLERHLKAQAERARFADIRFGVEWLGFEGENRQQSRLRVREGGELLVSHQYLIAADGAGSPVAAALDIERVGPDAIATFLNLTCEVDVARITGEGASLLYWILDPDVQGTIIVHDPNRLSVYMRPVAVPYESVEDYDDARCAELLRDVFAEQPYKVRHKGVWKMTAQVAARFRDGSVFLAGDAIHRFPPTGGLGLNTGVGDVHNLVWKLAVALQGEIAKDAIRALLDSYELERRPVAQRNCDVSKRNSDKMIEVVQAVGLDPSKGGLLAKLMNSTLVRRLPKALRRVVYGAVTLPVRKILADAERDDARGGEIRDRVAAAIDNQREHFSSLGLDLGYVYRDGCAVSDRAGETPESTVTTYAEALGAGARVPHRTLDGDIERLHDLLDYTAFTLLTADADEAASHETFGVPVNVVDVTSLRCPDGTPCSEALELPAGGWALVRPDGHVMASSP